MNAIIEEKVDIVFKNFYHDLFDIIEKNKLSNEEAFNLLASTFSTLVVATFKDDTPLILKLMKQHYTIMVKEHGKISEFMEENND